MCPPFAFCTRDANERPKDEGTACIDDHAGPVDDEDHMQERVVTADDHGIAHARTQASRHSPSRRPAEVINSNMCIFRPAVAQQLLKKISLLTLPSLSWEPSRGSKPCPRVNLRGRRGRPDPEPTSGFGQTRAGPRSAHVPRARYIAALVAKEASTPI
jgi:hypothetical protein